MYIFTLVDDTLNYHVVFSVLTSDSEDSTIQLSDIHNLILNSYSSTENHVIESITPNSNSLSKLLTSIMIGCEIPFNTNV